MGGVSLRTRSMCVCDPNLSPTSVSRQPLCPCQSADYSWAVQSQSSPLTDSCGGGVGVFKSLLIVDGPAESKYVTGIVSLPLLAAGKLLPAIQSADHRQPWQSISIPCLGALGALALLILGTATIPVQHSHTGRVKPDAILAMSNQHLTSSFEGGRVPEPVTVSWFP